MHATHSHSHHFGSFDRTISALGFGAALSAQAESAAESLAENLAERGLSARTVTLKLKTVDFDTATRAVTANTALHTAGDLFRSVVVCIAR